ncbi:STAS/SEC14 domain-containing protein [Ramlibacter terrae]|uniref:STAS/SEC14 domain-containing protein n=1 Tax=Ramlibacter terrae TaxID=2732511 RepID=A0ABX6P6I1_9BURK|nr:STAS/SEC14 domain-containing protein [Ramlibacter terrae]
MSFDVAVADQKTWMRVTVTGQPTLDQLLALVHVLGPESGDWPRDSVLVDLREVATQFTRGEQARIGEAAACSLAHMARIASVVPPERVTRVSERVAQRSGANVCVFDDEAEAVAWLNGEPVSVGAGRAQSGE